MSSLLNPDNINRIVAGIEYRNMSDLLADFRKYIEKDADAPIQTIDVNAALFLHDLCKFLNLGEPQRQRVLGKSAKVFVESELDTRVSVPMIH